MNRKRPWPSCRYSPGTCLEGLGITMRYLPYDIQYLDQDLNPGPTRYEAAALPLSVIPLFSILSLFWKNKNTLIRSPFCLRVCVSPLLTFECLNQSLWNLVRISRYLSSSQRHNFKNPSVIPALQTLRFLGQNLNIAWTPVLIFMKLGTYIMPPESISTAHFINTISNTNIAASQISEAKP
jgi:hypothetical protein